MGQKKLNKEPGYTTRPFEDTLANAMEWLKKKKLSFDTCHILIFPYFCSPFRQDELPEYRIGRDGRVVDCGGLENR